MESQCIIKTKTNYPSEQIKQHDRHASTNSDENLIIVMWQKNQLLTKYFWFDKCKRTTFNRQEQ
ncbi:hypothetical protein CVS40_4243 [Lucilia cuprina]|nr:hypothetical protein CVS40_4243 [Lucilia cuprina]